MERKLGMRKELSNKIRSWFSAFQSQKAFSFLFLNAAVVILYSLIGITCLHFATINENSSPFWPGTGLAIASLLIFGNRVLLGIFLGAFLTNLTTDIPFLAVAGIAAGNTLEALFGAWLYRKVTQSLRSTQLRRSVAILISVFSGSIVGSLIGTLTLLMAGIVPAPKFAYALLTWWGGDFVGGIVFLPFFLHLIHLRLKHFFSKPQDAPLFLTLSIAIAFVNYAVFVSRLPEGIYWANVFLIYMGILLLGRFSGQLLLVLTTILSIYYSHLGYSLFEFGSSNLNMLYLQGITSSLAVSIFFIEAVHRQNVSAVIHRVFFAGLSVIIAAVSFLAYEENRLKDFELQRLEEKVLSGLEAAERNYTTLLLGAAGMMETQEDFLWQDWQKFANTIQLGTYYRAVRGVGFVSEIPKSNAKEFQQQMQKAGLENFSIKILDAEYSSQFDNHYIITFIEPYKENTQARGLDLGSEARRRWAAEKAKEQKRAIATESIQLVQDSKNRPGFLIFYPVWKRSTSKFRGWAYAPVVAEQFFGSAMMGVTDKLNLKIIRGNDVLLGSKEVFPKDQIRSRYFVQKVVTLFGLDHQVYFHPTESFFLNNAGFPLIIGVILTLLLTVLIALISSISQFNSRLLREVKNKSRELDVERAKSIHTAKLASLGEMSAGIAHEINNPLAIITGTLSILEKSRSDENKFQERVEKIARATTRIERIVLGLRKFSRSSEESVKKLEDLNMIIQESVLLINAKAKQNFVEIKIETNGKALVLVDLIEIEQVLVNLLSNGIDAVKNLQEKWVKIVTQETQSEVIVRIFDSGNGISKEVEDKLFLPFFTTKPVGEGTGLGLSISKGILDQHGAKFLLNRDFVNTCFEIRFPKPTKLQKLA